MSVYRLPFSHSQHYAARIEWQPQTAWEFDGVPAAIAYIEGVGTFGGDTTLEGIGTSEAYTTGTGVISFPRVFDGVTLAVAYTLNTGTVDAELYTTSVSHLIARAPRSAMSARATRYKMNARLN